MKTLNRLFALAIVSYFAIGGVAAARDQIRIVGSSTVYPFSSYVAEEFGATTKYQTPVVESTGSGGGHKLFGNGAGLDTPDITNSSRRMKVSELERAEANGIRPIVEIKIGFDGIAFAHNKNNEPIDLTLPQIALAVAAKVPEGDKLVANPYKYWDDIDKELPHRKILIYGPPTTSGTRDAFEELVLEPVTKKMPAYGGAYMEVRQDGVYIDSGENDNLIVQKLAQDKDAFGIFGYSYLAENGDKIQGAIVNGVKPLPEAISSGQYPISRSLFFYVKVQHLDQVPGMGEYIDLFLSEKMIGPRGYLKTIGLIPLPDDMRAEVRTGWQKRTPLTAADLK